MSLQAKFRTVALGDPAKEPASAFWACFFSFWKENCEAQTHWVGLGCTTVQSPAKNSNLIAIESTS